MSAELDAAIGRLEAYFQTGRYVGSDRQGDLRMVVAAAKEVADIKAGRAEVDYSEFEARDREIAALTAVIEEVKDAITGSINGPEMTLSAATALSGIFDALSRAPEGVLAERDNRIRTEVIDWLESQYSGGPATTAAIQHAREHFGIEVPADA